MDTISLTIPPKTIYLKSMRLLAASLASDIGFDIEEVEDIRVVVSEAINYKMSDRNIKINFYTKENLMKVEVIGKDREIEEENLKIKQIILEQLADKVEVVEDKIILTKEK
ncbi:MULTISPECIES: serine-protein kinase RsbW family protein [Anaerococcus]|uniref:Anti-sigma regulatory factor n=1 Tax=Anaerococcus obesiensis TaxID=1287640 RepID=A0A7T7ZVI5_9FIRM|nr:MULTISPECIES: serine-protein kinase RsbW family protein [Anaerococcus]MBS4889897.1 anti-sigma regulatory factor [Anaerococcus vaginalis]MBS6921643.1 anti-sigma regulatory factor [Anaerococcus vaginalis]MDU0944998.1 anti-sigma regulatory factor [Anaerococcus vaginalis]MDU1030515.1 anti-sigma regulatory factor [Anaerococcus vaginalis]MDU2649595.1 anti-sigma regulatory factor [Anaerococcus vaginalis]